VGDRQVPRPVAGDCMMEAVAASVTLFIPLIPLRSNLIGPRARMLSAGE
jgi:hypothetical protein